MKNDNLSDFLLWVFAFIVLIAGAALTSETVPGGLCVILAGALMLPSFSQWSESLLHVRVPLWARAGMFIVFLFIGTWFSGERMRSDLELPKKTQMEMYR